MLQLLDGMVGLLSTEHLGAVAVILAAAAVLTIGARHHPGPWLWRTLWALGTLLLLAEASWWAYLVLTRNWTPASGLPLQLCDTGALVAVAALWWRRHLLVELTWFWGLAGTAQALLTPGLCQHFPDWLFFQYYLVHGAVVASAVLLAGIKFVPRPGAVRRVLLLTAAYTALVGVADVLTGGDYMYLRQPPPTHSLLDLMGPWPWYLVTSAALALVLFWALDLPFRIRRRMA